jgi:hypothetical protein
VERRSETLARNESLFREVNERIEEVSWNAGLGDRFEILCECGRRDCLEPLRVLRSEYESVRAEPDRFLVAPGHEHEDMERVVTRTDRFEIVEKLGRAAVVAAAADPRA